MASHPMAMVHEPGKVEFEDREILSPGEGQVLIKTKAVSICGSDLHTFHGKHPFAPLPAALGHELAGEVVELGPGVTRLKVGDRVCLEPVIICEDCVFCERGDYHLCRNISFHHRQGQGAFTPFFTADQAWVHQLPENVSFAEGALIEPLAVAIHAVGRANLKMGDSVAVFGSGAIGLLVMILAQRSGAGEILAVDVQDRRLEQALELGASAGFNNLKVDPVEEIIAATDGLGADAAFEAVGLGQTLNQVLACLRKGGTGVMAGLISGNEVTLPANIFVAKELTLKGTQGYCRDFQTAIRFLRAGRLDIRPLITHTLSPDQLQEGFELLDDPGSGAIKVVIEYD